MSTGYLLQSGLPSGCTSRQPSIGPGTPTRDGLGTHGIVREDACARVGPGRSASLFL